MTIDLGGEFLDFDRKSQHSVRMETSPLHCDGKKRCHWPGEDALYLAYHDEEWGVPEYDDRALFEKFILDGFQAGLSWITILRRRESFHKAFDDFDPAKIARYTPAKLAGLMQDQGIIRNRAKIAASVASAQAFLALQDEGGFSHYLWNFVDGAPLQNKFRRQDQIPAETPLSAKISKDLKQRGFKFCGPTIVYAFMQAVGMVNDHVTTCFRHGEVAALMKRG